MTRGSRSNYHWVTKVNLVYLVCFHDHPTQVAIIPEEAMRSLRHSKTGGPSILDVGAAGHYSSFLVNYSQLPEALEQLRHLASGIGPQIPGGLLPWAKYFTVSTNCKLSHWLEVPPTTLAAVAKRNVDRLTDDLATLGVQCEPSPVQPFLCDFVINL